MTLSRAQTQRKQRLQIHVGSQVVPFLKFSSTATKVDPAAVFDIRVRGHVRAAKQISCYLTVETDQSLHVGTLKDTGVTPPLCKQACQHSLALTKFNVHV